MMMMMMMMMMGKKMNLIQKKNFQITLQVLTMLMSKIAKKREVMTTKITVILVLTQNT